MNTQEQIYKLKEKAVKNKRFKSRCYVCHAKFNHKAGFTFHHIWYVVGEKIYSSFDKNSKGRLEYTKYVIKQVKNNPKRFLLLCSKHHVVLERMKRWNKINLNRLIKAVRMESKK